MRRLAFLLVLATLVVGCGDDGTGADADISGNYSLKTVNGGNLPYVILQVGNDKAEVTSGSVAIHDDGSLTRTFSYRVTEGGQVSTSNDVAVATWTKAGNQLTARWSDGTTSTGVLAGDRITVIEDGVSYVFEK